MEEPPWIIRAAEVVPTVESRLVSYEEVANSRVNLYIDGSIGEDIDFIPCLETRTSEWSLTTFESLGRCLAEINEAETVSHTNDPAKLLSDRTRPPLVFVLAPSTAIYIADGAYTHQRTVDRIV